MILEMLGQPSAERAAFVMKSGDFYLGSRTRDSANRSLALNQSSTVACIRSDTHHRGGVVKSQASVCGIPGPTLKIKSPDFIKILHLCGRGFCAA